MTRSGLKLLLRAAVSIALLALVLRNVRWADLAAVLSRANLLWALLGAILTPALIAALASRWLIFLRQQNLHLSPGQALSLTWAGLFFNSCLPGSMGGDVVRIVHLCRLMPQGRAAAAASVLTDRASALFALILLAIIGCVIEPAPLRLLADGAPSLLRLLFAVVIAMVAGVLLFRLIRQHRRFAQAARVAGALLGSLKPSRSMALGFSLALGIHLLNFFIIFLFTRALGLRISYAEVVLMMSVVFLASLLPVTINGHGLRELLFIGYFNQLGITTTTGVQSSTQGMALALSLLMILNELLWVIPGGIWYLWARGTSQTGAVAARTDGKAKLNASS